MITTHRRENLGDPMRNVFRAIKRIKDEQPDIKAIHPVHMNPVVSEEANEILGNCDSGRIIVKMEVLGFYIFTSKSYLILTDIVCILEEALA
jgi:UDP-N-acetylglucosamine 2-epimerase (non-hydrolysing)